MNHPANAALHRGTMQTLQDMLYRHHPGVQFYKQALELTQGMGPDQQCKITLRFDESTDPRHYNLPTTTSNEIAVILPGDGDQPTSTRDIVLHRHGGGLKEISDLHPLYPSLHYVLLFPTGQLGWNHNIPYAITADNQDDAGEDEEDQEGQGGQRGKRKTVSQAEYSRYHQITSSWLESFFRSTLLTHGLPQSNHALIGSGSIKQSLGQRHTRDLQMQW